MEERKSCFHASLLFGADGGLLFLFPLSQPGTAVDRIFYSLDDSVVDDGMCSPMGASSIPSHFSNFLKSRLDGDAEIFFSSGTIIVYRRFFVGEGHRENQTSLRRSLSSSIKSEVWSIGAFVFHWSFGVFVYVDFQ